MGDTAELGTRAKTMRVLVTTREGAVRDRTRAINQLKGMIVSAPDALRDRLRDLGGAHLVDRCARLRHTGDRPADYEATVSALRRIAKRIQHLDAEIKEHDRDLKRLTSEHCPQLVAEVGVESHRGRPYLYRLVASRPLPQRSSLRSPGGIAPIAATSGQVAGIDLTVAVTVNSTGRSTPWYSPEPAVTTLPRRTSHDDKPKVKAHEKPDAA